METLTKNVLQDQATKTLEKELIKSMAGNYRVSFKFAETFSPIKDYQYADRHFSSAKEVVLILGDLEHKISLQHILYVGNHLIKHWRQDWLYENDVVWDLVKNHHWKKRILDPEEVRGTWTQKVFQVDDAPRYEGLGTWVHVDGRHFWESTADAALPRREISTAGRTDYNVLRRHSHIEIFEDGSWILEQDNDKIHRDTDGQENLICMEKGLETLKPKSYDATKVTEFWQKQENFWADVRLIWEDIRNHQDEIIIKDDEGLYKTQFELASQFEGAAYDKKKSHEAIKSTLANHLQEVHF